MIFLITDGVKLFPELRDYYYQILKGSLDMLNHLATLNVGSQSARQ